MNTDDGTVDRDADERRIDGRDGTRFPRRGGFRGSTAFALGGGRPVEGEVGGDAAFGVVPSVWKRV